MAMFHVQPDQQPGLAGLDSFDAFMNCDGGEIIKRKGMQQVTRLTLDGRKYYLKHSLGPDKILPLLMRGQWPHVSCIRELLAIQYLHRAGLPVMRPVAWGERRCCGIGREGFLMIEHVDGRDVLDWYNTTDPGGPEHIAALMGDLQGRLHAAGFFMALRLRDLIAPNDNTLVMIDREATRPGPRAVTAKRRIDSLARCYCKNRSMADAPVTEREAKAFLAAYLRADASTDEANLYDRVAAKVQRLSAPGAKYHQAT